MLALAGCDDGDSSAETTTTSTTTTTVAPIPDGPTLDTNTDDVEAAMRSLLEFDFWSEANPEAAADRVNEWVVEDSPWAERVDSAVTEQLEQGTYATGRPDVLDVLVEAQSENTATVLVWMRSDGYRFDGPAEYAFDSPPFERTLFIFELQREAGSPWRIYERRIALGV